MSAGSVTATGDPKLDVDLWFAVGGVFIRCGMFGYICLDRRRRFCVEISALSNEWSSWAMTQYVIVVKLMYFSI